MVCGRLFLIAEYAHGYFSGEYEIRFRDIEGRENIFFAPSEKVTPLDENLALVRLAGNCSGIGDYYYVGMIDPGKRSMAYHRVHPKSICTLEQYLQRTLTLN